MILDIQKESHMDDFTGLVGSGPAYFFYLLQVYEKTHHENFKWDLKRRTL
jgi:pyrroline-5-carboxylate reductase